MALPRASDVEYVGASMSGGTCLGQSATELVGFHGATPSDQRAVTSAVSTSAPVSNSGVWGFATSAQHTALIAAVNEVIALLKEKGLMASA